MNKATTISKASKHVVFDGEQTTAFDVAKSIRAAIKSGESQLGLLISLTRGLEAPEGMEFDELLATFIWKMATN